MSVWSLLLYQEEVGRVIEYPTDQVIVRRCHRLSVASQVRCQDAAGRHEPDQVSDRQSPRQACMAASVDEDY